MLTLIIPGEELFDEATSSFQQLDSAVLLLEHSLVSLSKWESKWHIAFLGPQEKTSEMIVDYIRCMILNDVYDPSVFDRFTQETVDQINAYIESPYSATTFGAMPKTRQRAETITSELIYYWMVALTIPFEAETWHLNRLFALIRICNLKNSKPKQMPKSEIAQRNRELNAQRREQLGTSG